MAWADEKTRNSYNCEICAKNPANLISRKCEEPGFSNLKKPRQIDDKSLKYFFCPGKATWYPEIAELFRQCRVAMETGIMPKEGSFEDQDEMFVDAFPEFIERWKRRQYLGIWQDIRQYVETVLKALFDKKGKR